MSINNNLETFTLACHYAAKCHAKQKRKGNDEPYIVHPLEVVNILTKTGVDDYECLAAAVLHDVIEDTKATKVELSYHFGDKICSIVEEVTDDKTLKKGERKSRQERGLSNKSDEAKLIKLADKISNISSFRKREEWPPSWTPRDVYDYCIWSLKVGVRAFFPSNVRKNLFYHLVSTVVEVNRAHIQDPRLSDYCLSLLLNEGIPPQMKDDVDDYYKRCNEKE